ncbi:MAG: 1,4-dihydroxy-2-naphthoate polyprenyltransferase [Cyclobacteriaceae bacterium]
MDQHSFKAWMQAFRLRTLPLAFSSIILGGLLAYSAGNFSWLIFGMTLLTTLFLQVLSNLANDYGDAQSGVDSVKREGPSRTVQKGLITMTQMKVALIIFSLLSLLSGVALIWLSFQDDFFLALVFLILGVAAIWAAISYTVGKTPYGYAGFGDIFVLLFFGLVGVIGSAFSHMRTIEISMFLPATSCGLLAVGVLNVNNIRDIKSDRESGKRSIPVRIGRANAVKYHGALLGLSFILACIYNLLNPSSYFQWIFLLVTPMWYMNFKAVKTKLNAKELDPYLKQLAISTLLFALAFGFGQLSF